MKAQDGEAHISSGMAGRLVSMTDIRKAFPGVQAISRASFDLAAGEIHALVGENGAGKSTLIKILTGVHQADGGEVGLLGRPVRFSCPLEAQRAGIATIYQELALVPQLSVAANIFLGNEETRHGRLDHRRELNRAAALMTRLGADIDPSSLVSTLTIAQQQLVEIARALGRDARVLVMDEPTAALAPREVEQLFVILRELSGRGIGVLFISHRLDEVLQIAHRITVMRDGATIATRTVGEYTRARLIEDMVGREIAQEYPERPSATKEVCFEVRELSGGPVHRVSFTACRGEILGLAGLMGAGRTDTARLIFGADRKTGGEILLDGRVCHIGSPRDAIRLGICLLTEDRKRQGLVLGASALENFALPNLHRWSRFAWIKRAIEVRSFRRQVDSLGIRISSPRQRAEELSGGNQQKLLVARWLQTDSRIILFDEPTRGIDVGARYDMYLLINRLAAQGRTVIVISSELPELLGMCDRILVMRRGEISGEIADVSNASQEEIMALAV